MLTYHYSGSFPVRGGGMVGAGGMETWGGRRSAAYASMCGPLLPFLREGGPGAVTGTESRSAMFRFLPGSIRPAGGVRVFSGTAGTCRVRVRDPGALRGRLGAGVVAYVPRYGAYVTLSRAPRETALFPVHCSHSSLPGRYASAAYTPVCGGTTGNMPRIPAGGVLRYASVCVGMVHL